MQKLAAVEEAKALFEVAKDWSVWRWVTEKGRARKTGDAANHALAAQEKKTIDSWPDDLKKAYREIEAAAALDGTAESKKTYKLAQKEAAGVSAEVKRTVQKVKEALDEAEEVRLSAEDAFAEADRRLSASLAREGAAKAHQAWEMREKAIRKAEAAARHK